MLFSYDMLVSRTCTLPPEYRPKELVAAAFPFAAALDDPKRLMEPEAARNAALLFSHCARFTAWPYTESLPTALMKGRRFCTTVIQKAFM